MTVYNDSLQIKYDKNKCDQTGKNTSIKHVYANPSNPFVCSFLSLGIYLSLNADRYEQTEMVFRRASNEKSKVSAACYCSQLKELVNRKQDAVKNYVHLAHSNAHGFRKGAGTYATSGTTCPPPIPSVAR